MCASAGGGALAEELRSLPDRLYAAERFRRKVVRANQEGVTVQGLGAGWLIIGIVQTDQGVPQERSELAASLFQLCGRRRGRLEHFCQVRSHLHFGVMIVIDSGRPFRSFATRENRPRHLECAYFPGLMDHELVRRFSLTLFGQGIAQCKQRVERNQALAVQHGTHSEGKLPMDPHSFLGSLPRSRQQLDDFVLRNFLPRYRQIEVVLQAKLAPRYTAGQPIESSRMA